MTRTPWQTRLPRSNRPVAHESLAGYLLNLSQRLNVTPGQLMLRTGLKTGARANLLDLSYSVTIPPDIQARFGTATGLEQEQVLALTLDGIGPVLDMSRPGKRLARSNYGNKWINPGRTAACPGCLGEDPHPTWRTTWMTPWALACTRHHTELIDRCPNCNTPLGEPGATGTRSLIPQPSAQVATASECRARLPDRSLCRFDLASAPTAAAEPRLLDLQTLLDQAIDTPSQHAHTVLGHRVSSNQWLRDLRLVALALNLTDLRSATPRADAHPHLGPSAGNGRRRTRAATQPPDHIAATQRLILEAHQLLADTSRAGDLNALNKRAANQATSIWEQAKNKGGPSVALTEAFTKHQMRATQPNRLALYIPVSCNLPADRLPAYLPAAQFDDHLADMRGPSRNNPSRSRYARPLRRYATIAIAMHSHGIDASAAGRLLGYPDTLTKAACARASLASRDHGGEPELFRRLRSIAESLANESPVDYATRRDHFDADWRIADEDFAQLQANLPRRNTPWETRRLDYSVYLWATITGGDPILAPMTRTLRNGRHSTNHNSAAHDYMRWGDRTLAALTALAAKLATEIGS